MFISTSTYLGRVLCAVAVCVSLLSFADADVTSTGDVNPKTPTSWKSKTVAYIGKTGVGTVSATNGSTLLDYSAYIGYESTATGEVSIDGAGSTWTHEGTDPPSQVKDGYLWVGFEGGGALNITNGGAVIGDEVRIGTSSGSTGEVTVDGVGSTWAIDGPFYIGAQGDGTLNISNGGTVNSSLGRIGVDSTGTGEVTVDGAGSTWNNSSVFCVAYEGSGTLNIINGGTVNSDTPVIGDQASSTGEVTVNGPGSTFDASGTLTVGASGSGLLNITNGGVVSNDYVAIGYASGSTGEVTVDGAGSIWTSGNLYVGDGGDGILNITNGGAVSSTSDSYIGYWSGSAGEATVKGIGSTWNNSTVLHVGSGGSGLLNITDGGLVSVAGVLVMGLGGEGGNVNMSTGGMLALYGQADSSLVAFMGLIIGTDTIRYWDAGISDWADITGATLGVDYWLDYHTTGDLAGYTVLTVGVSLDGADLDGSGSVGQGDLDIVLDSWGDSPPSDPRADPSGDGAVGQADLDIILDNWGNAGPPPPSGGASSSQETLSLPSTAAEDEPADPQDAPTAKELRQARKAAKRAPRQAKPK